MLEGLHLAWTSLPSRSGVWQTEPADRVYQSSLPIESADRVLPIENADRACTLQANTLSNFCPYLLSLLIGRVERFEA